MFKKTFAAIGAFLLPLAVRAQDLGGAGLEDARKAANYQPAQIEDVLGKVIQAFLGLVGAIFLILIVYGGYNWMIARGDESRVDKAKDTITRAIIGLVITVGAYAITYFILSRVLPSGVTTPAS